MAADDEDRDAILRRRQRFLAVALGGVTVVGACGDDDDGPPPQVCLSAPFVDEVPPPADPGPPPMPCLEPVEADELQADPGVGSHMPGVGPEACLGISGRRLPEPEAEPPADPSMDE